MPKNEKERGNQSGQSGASARERGICAGKYPVLIQWFAVGVQVDSLAEAPMMAHSD